MHTETVAQHTPSEFDVLAERVLAGGSLEPTEAMAVLQVSETQLPTLLHAAFRVRERYHGRRVKICQLRNARSGLCPEDCHYCSQSAISEAAIPRYRLGFGPRAAGRRPPRRASGAQALLHGDQRARSKCHRRRPLHRGRARYQGGISGSSSSASPSASWKRSKRASSRPPASAG